MGRRGALTGAVLGLVPACILLLVTHPASDWSGYPVLDFLGFTGWVLFIWPALGWAIGYFMPFIQGGNGINKALWVYAAAAASLPMNLLWLDGRDWDATLVYYLELFAFLLILSVILCDLVDLCYGPRPPGQHRDHRTEHVIKSYPAKTGAVNRRHAHGFPGHTRTRWPERSQSRAAAARISPGRGAARPPG
jgi:hypothetical protein